MIILALVLLAAVFGFALGMFGIHYTKIGYWVLTALMYAALLLGIYIGKRLRP